MPAIRILIVDDERRFVETLSKRLAARGLEVAGALSAEEALGLVRTREFDVVLLDVLMPQVDGLQALSEIKRVRPALQVILLSGNTSINAAVEGMRLGALDYLLKPAGLDELLAKVEEAAEKTRLEAQRLSAQATKP